MTHTDFLKDLQQVDPTLHIKPHPQNTDIAGIYWGDIYTETAIPSGEIYPERMENYQDNFGYAHRGANEAIERVKAFIVRYNSDEEFRNDVNGVE